VAGRTRTAKSLARRIDMNYFKRLHPFRRWRLLLSIGAPLVVLLFLGAFAAAGSRAPYSSGPVSAAHQVFGQRCELCHTTATTAFRAHVSDMSCVACHDAPAHKTNQTDTPACASCHLDHRGAIQLAAVDDQNCLQCHRDLKIASGQPTVADSIGSFGGDHPEFAVRRDGALDRGVLRFNHEVHAKTDLRGPGGPTKLDCVTCHKPAAPPVPAVAANAGGRRHAGGDPMAPITYAANCASCHPLYFDPLIDAAAPHETPDKVHAFVVQALEQFIAANPGQIGRPDPVRGRIPVSFPAPMRPVTTATEWTAERTTRAEQLLWSKTCAECHTVEPAAGAIPRIVATSLRTSWMPHARFDHRAHQLATCTSCHAATTSRETSDVLMPSIATCQACHTPRTGAEARCFECHGYHDWTKEKPPTGGFDLNRLTTTNTARPAERAESDVSATFASAAVIVTERPR
jgi:hypothetical protein